MPSIWDMLFPGASQAPQFGGQDPNAQLPVPFPGPQQAPWLPQTTPWPQDAAPLTAQQRYRASQAGDESRLPQYERSRSTLPVGMWNNLVETATRVQTPPPQLPPGVTDTDFAGLAVKRDGQWVPWKEADPQAAGAYYEEMQKRADLPMNVAMGMVGGGAGFAGRGTAGMAGGKLVQPMAKVAAADVPNELFHVVGEGYKSGQPLQSLYKRYGDAAYDMFAQKWPEAGGIGDYHVKNNFFYDNLNDALNHSEDFGGKVLKVDPKKVDNLQVDKLEIPYGKDRGFYYTNEDVPAHALSEVKIRGAY